MTWAVLSSFLVAAFLAVPAEAQLAWGTDRTSTLYQFDPTTGVATSVGALGIGPVTGSAIDPATGVYYTNPGGGGCCPTPTSGCLYTVSLATGAATQVGCDPAQGGRDPIPGLGFAPDGTFYGVRLAANAAPADGDMHLCTIDKTTGAVTDVVGPVVDDWCIGYGAGFGADGNLYVWSGCVGMLRVSTADASRTVLGGSWVGFPPDARLRIPDMGRAPNGTLWAVVVGDSGNYTATVNTTTGDVTYVATLSTGINTIEFGAAAGPTVAGVSPNVGPIQGGITVTISGTGLSGATSVTFGGVAGTITGNTDTSITVTIPPHALGTVDVVVTTGAGATTFASAFRYVDGAWVPTLGPWLLGLLAAALAAVAVFKLRA